MPLDATTLESDIAAVFAAHPPSKEECAEKLAAAYHKYAKGGLFGAAFPVLDDSRRDALASTLATSLSVPGVPGTHAAAWTAGVTAYWLGVLVSSEPVVITGTISTPPNTGALTATLTTALGNVLNTVQVISAALATALHTATAAIQATVQPPPGTVVPIA
jgi:hypothetical protein